ncbi:MAG TPA: SDR family oxidoreductase [Actinomycetota bacterium]|nr:SDR family oxidoreductase [Actinomycetota bacterium]
MDLGLRGKVALVTGSTSGLGLASARALSGEGASVVICGRRGDLAVQEAAAMPGEGLGLEADLTDPATPQRLVDATREAFGTPDVLVFSTGGPPPGTAAATEEGRYEEALRLLVTPLVALSRLVLPAMRERGWGRIVYVTSAAMREPIDNLVLSNSVRLAVHGFAKTLAREVASDGVTVNCVMPGRLDTDRVGALDAAAARASGRSIEEVRAAAAAAIPAGRYGEPAELGAVVAFLCSAPAGYVTGASVPVDGGALRSH